MEKTFIILLKYTAALSRIDSLLDEHRAYLKKYYENGHFRISGRMEPRTGGVIICRAESREEVMNILAEDPFAKASVAQYDLIEFLPTRWDAQKEAFEPWQ